MTTELISYLNDQLKILGELVESGMAKQSEYLLLSVEIENQKLQKMIIMFNSLPIFLSLIRYVELKIAVLLSLILFH